MTHNFAFVFLVQGVEQNWKKIVYFEGPLYFANAELFDERFRSLNPIPVTVQSGECKNAKKSETVVRFFSGKQEVTLEMKQTIHLTHRGPN